MKGELKWFILNLGLSFREVQELYCWFERNLEQARACRQTINAFNGKR